MCSRPAVIAAPVDAIPGRTARTKHSGALGFSGERPVSERLRCLHPVAQGEELSKPRLRRTPLGD